MEYEAAVDQRPESESNQLLMKFGAAKKEAGRAASLVEITLPSPNQPVTPEAFRFQLRRDKLRKVRRHEGQYLLRLNLCAEDPAVLWKYYMLLGGSRRSGGAIYSCNFQRPRR